MADWYMHWKGVYQKRIAELQAENERLREELAETAEKRQEPQAKQENKGAADTIEVMQRDIEQLQGEVRDLNMRLEKQEA